MDTKYVNSSRVWFIHCSFHEKKFHLLPDGILIGGFAFYLFAAADASDDDDDDDGAHFTLLMSLKHPRD